MRVGFCEDCTCWGADSPQRNNFRGPLKLGQDFSVADGPGNCLELIGRTPSMFFEGTAEGNVYLNRDRFVSLLLHTIQTQIRIDEEL